MAVTTDIARTYRAPREVVAKLLAMGKREDRAFAYVAIGCLLVFVSQLPKLSRDAVEQEIEFGVLISNSFMGILIIWPLALYLIAAIIYLINHYTGGGRSHYHVRLALFWGFLAASPLVLLYGLTVAFIGQNFQANLVGLVWIGAIVVFTWRGLGARNA